MEVLDIQPKFNANMTIELKGSRGTNLTYDGDIPKELMDEYQSIVGNGLAKVSVSADVGIKEFGTGAGSMVVVSLTCNQDQQTIQRALGLAGHVARWFAKENRQLAENELNQLIEQRKLSPR